MWNEEINICLEINILKNILILYCFFWAIEIKNIDVRRSIYYYKIKFYSFEILHLIYKFKK